jgi:capping protein (actin filament) muscle Z-line, beta
MRRLPPQKVEENLASLIDILPDLTEDLLSAVDQPLKVKSCPRTGKEYLLCDYNRDADSFRSPWSNEYDPPMDDGTVPSVQLRKLEQACNDAFDTYRELYYDGGVSSVYAWDLDSGFACVVLIKKVVSSAATSSSSGSGSGGGQKGSWDSIHVFEVDQEQVMQSKQAHYKLTSTIMLYTNTNKLPSIQSGSQTSLSGSMTRQLEQDLPVVDNSSGDQIAGHVGNLGRMVEDMEFKMRHSLQEIYFGKTKDILNDLRSVVSQTEKNKQSNMQRELALKLTEKSSTAANKP